MKHVLLTAFEPYGEWPANASWLCLQELTRELPTNMRLTTRRYPVDFDQVRDRLAKDLAADVDVALHLGQAPGSTRVRLEQFAMNVRGGPDAALGAAPPLCPDGPPAYSSALPLANWTEKLRAAGIPAQTSYHAGTYLCNAILYWSHHLAKQNGLGALAAFVHLPLECSQTLGPRGNEPSLPATLTARAIRILLDEIAAS